MEAVEKRTLGYNIFDIMPSAPLVSNYFSKSLNPTLKNSFSSGISPNSFIDGAIYGILQSANFDEGEDGWRIKPNGDVEFNDGTFRGDLDVGGLLRTIDNTSDIQDALDELQSAGGGTLYLKPGTYSATALTGYSSVSIIGISPSETIIDFGNTTANLTYAGTSIYSTGTITNISAGVNVTGSGTAWLSNATAGQHLFIGTRWYLIAAITDDTHLVLAEGYGDDVTLPSTYRIATPKRNIVIKNLTLKNSTGTALVITDARNITIDNILLLTNNKGAVFTNVSECNADRTIVVGSTSNGIEITNMGLSDWESVNTISNGGAGLVATNVRTMTFLPCASNSNTGNGFTLTSCKSLLIIPEASGNGAKGIEFVSSNENITILSGPIKGNTSDGIKLTATSDIIKILSNDIESNGGYGVNIATSTCDNTVITTNYFASNSSGQVNDSGTGTVIRGNVGVDDNPTSGLSQVVKTYTIGENVGALKAVQVVSSSYEILTPNNITTNDSAIPFGQTTQTNGGQTFLGNDANFATSIKLRLKKTGSPVDNVTVSIEADSGGVPSGISLYTGTFPMGSLSTSFGTHEITLSGTVSLTAGSTYWIVLGRSGATNNSNYPEFSESGLSSTYASGQGYTKTSGVWSALAGGGQDLEFAFVYDTVVGDIHPASATSTLLSNSFIGFTFAAYTKGNTGKVIIAGQVGGLSGLVPGTFYYLSDTSGSISSSPGSNTRKVGIATSTTTLLITNIW